MLTAFSSRLLTKGGGSDALGVLKGMVKGGIIIVSAGGGDLVDRHLLGAEQELGMADSAIGQVLIGGCHIITFKKAYNVIPRVPELP